MRVEFLHSAFAHFPIAIAFICIFTKGLEIAVRPFHEKLAKDLEIICRYLLFCLPLFLMITVFIGDEALEAVKSSACNLAKIYRHEELGERAIIVVSLALVIQVLILLKNIKSNLKKILNIILFVVLCFNGYVIGQTAHIGGELVFDDGVAVKPATRECE